jgi:hypothetical protein
MIVREIYLNKLRKYRDKKLIKVITGIRRCGKSTLMQLFQKHLTESGVESNQIIAINFEDFEYYDLLETKTLYAYLKEKISDSRKKYYIFLDEIQQVDNFERIMDSLYIKDNVDLYVTGSNAKLLSGELSTLLSGRYVEIMMLPLSFKEFVSAHSQPINFKEVYNRYIQYGSLPYVLELDEDEEIIRGYLEGVFNTVVLKDIVARKKIADVMMLDSVIRFLFDVVGSIISIKKISDTLTSSGRKISSHTVESYITGLVDSFVLYPVKRYDIKGKQHLKTLEKYYIADLGLRYLQLGNRGVDLGHLLENVVYLELLRRGYDVYIGKIDAYEIDFIAVSQKETLYYQVAFTVKDKETLERELRPLRAVSDHYPKYIITLDDDIEISYDGIRVINAIDFLLET